MPSLSCTLPALCFVCFIYVFGKFNKTICKDKQKTEQTNKQKMSIVNIQHCLQTHFLLQATIVTVVELTLFFLKKYS